MGNGVSMKKTVVQAKPSRRRGERGQTLILGVLAMVVLLLAIILLFDLQNVIRIKIKSWAGADAAALAGSQWQVNTLNLIGELNLIKACTTLVTDIPPLAHDTPESIEAKSALLCEMQARVSFVGPLIGFAAAQQAAKNNGINVNPNYGTIDERGEPVGVVGEHLKRLRGYVNGRGDTIASVYLPPDVPAQIEGYTWKEPYENMIETILTQGIAVAPNCHYMGAPRLEGNEFVYYLQNRHVYDAINANYWCYIRDLLRMDFTGKWWGDIELQKDSTSFPEEAEYLTVDIEFSKTTKAYDDAVAYGGFATVLKNRTGMTLIGDAYDRFDTGKPGDTDGKDDLLPHITWATYGETWLQEHAPDPNYWGGAMYLRSDLKPEYVYAGAVARMACRTAQTTMSGMWNSKESYAEQKSLGESVSFSDVRIDGKSFKDSGDRLKYAEEQMRMGLDDVMATSLGKPLGKLTPDGGKATPPNYSSMILPVFDKATIIPLSMGDPGGLDPFDYQWYAFVTEYLPALGTVTQISDMGPGVVPNSDHWSWFVNRHNALLKLDDPRWRQQGLDWLDTMTYIIIHNADGTTTRVPNGTNESHCDDWPPGTGHREGPTHLP